MYPSGVFPPTYIDTPPAFMLSRQEKFHFRFSYSATTKRLPVTSNTRGNCRCTLFGRVYGPTGPRLPSRKSIPRDPLAAGIALASF